VTGPVVFGPGVFIAGDAVFTSPGPEEMLIKPGLYGN